MSAHPAIMHSALQNASAYCVTNRFMRDYMDTPNERLRAARERAGFHTAKEAAQAMGVPVSTYIGHENGHRGFPAKRAPQYARKFKVSEEWLLYGKQDTGQTAEVVDLYNSLPAQRRREAIAILKLLGEKEENVDV